MRVEAAGVGIRLFMGQEPAVWPTLCKHAVLSERFATSRQDQTVCGFAFSWPSDAEWPRVVITQAFSPDPSAGFFPGALVVPETGLALVGAGERILAYDLGKATRLWEDSADTGFWGWCRHGETVVMSAELELAAFSLAGQKLWSTFVEPPWSYTVQGAQIVVDVMGSIRSFSLQTGPKG